ncbi:putative Zinc finger, SWIM-type, MULE transposase domain, FHY3/FAR1 family [Helianthus annuus]|nr:putative Zinc finger, SWIM-type, MULE transposase domain, FHY3/FAR1 family [Helianthus annuus]
MVVEKFNERSKNLMDYTFKYETIETELISLFWVDNVSKRNYEAFGDVVAFDATYKTNMYNMIFVPFTGVDHHKKCTVFGAALLHNETIESYTWLLRMFVAVHGKQPVLILTDQDPAMKQAIHIVLDKSIHRLCMWHIIEKLPLKIDGDVGKNKKFRKAFHKLVWNVYIEPSTFERRWNRLMDEYGLQDHPWLSDMYAMRVEWIPAYFRDIPMCCLMKTTSRCESANHRFKSNSSARNTLVQFMLCFETTLEGQRHDQRVLDYSTEETTPRFKTPLAIERHANEIYTRTIFFEVQKEIDKGFRLSYIVERGKTDGLHTYVVAHQSHTSEIINEFKVTIDLSDHSVTCVCMGFTRVGYLCRHVFCVFRTHNIEKIPLKYVHPRWRKDALPSSIHSLANRYFVNESKRMMLRRRIIDNIQMCTDRVRCNDDKLEELDRQVQLIKDKIFEEFPSEPSYNKNGVIIEELISHSEPSEVTVIAPKGIRNKGCGKHKRLVGSREKGKQKNKGKSKLPFKKKGKSKFVKKIKKRKCNFCNELVDDHDSRNCPIKTGKPVKKKKKPSDEDEIDEIEDEEEMDFESSDEETDVETSEQE